MIYRADRSPIVEFVPVGLLSVLKYERKEQILIRDLFFSLPKRIDVSALVAFSF